jgi:hypothetical protein
MSMSDEPLQIQPPESTPSLWFVTDGQAWRLDDPRSQTGMTPMTERQRAICRALIELVTAPPLLHVAAQVAS